MAGSTPALATSFLNKAKTPVTTESDDLVCFMNPPSSARRLLNLANSNFKNIIMNKSNNYGMTQCQKCNATISVDTQDEHWCKTHSVQQIIGYIAAAQSSNEVAA
jgi:D-alanyl-D-alanine carboxypeptidase